MFIFYFSTVTKTVSNRTSDDGTVKSHEQFLYQLQLQGRLKPNTPPRRYSRMLVPDQIFEKRKQFVPCSLSQVRFEN